MFLCFSVSTLSETIRSKSFCRYSDTGSFHTSMILRVSGLSLCLGISILKLNSWISVLQSIRKALPSRSSKPGPPGISELTCRSEFLRLTRPNPLEIVVQRGPRLPYVHSTVDEYGFDQSCGWVGSIIIHKGASDDGAAASHGGHAGTAFVAPVRVSALVPELAEVVMIRGLMSRSTGQDGRLGYDIRFETAIELGRTTATKCCHVLGSSATLSSLMGGCWNLSG
jgi:hypothetical protein